MMGPIKKETGPMTKEDALKTYFGYDTFRGGQEPVIDALLSSRDALAIMPTGAGKLSKV